MQHGNFIIFLLVWNKSISKIKTYYSFLKEVKKKFFGPLYNHIIYN